MIRTSHEWIQAFSELTQTAVISNLSLARALRADELYTRPAPGRAHFKTSPSASHLANFLMAQGSGLISDAAASVRQLRVMKFRGHAPAFGVGTFGEVFDRLVEGDDPLPHEIRISVSPYRAAFIWQPDGERPRANSYTPDVAERPLGANVLLRETFLSPRLIELARQFATSAAQTKGATPARVTPSSKSTASAENSDRPKSEATPRLRGSSTPKTKSKRSMHDVPRN